MKQRNYHQEGIIALDDEELEGITGGAENGSSRWNTWQRDDKNSITLQQHYQHNGLIEHGVKRKFDLAKDSAYVPQGALNTLTGKTYREDL